MTTSPSFDPGAFREFEHSGWQSVSQRYHDSFAGLTTQAVGPLLDAVGAADGVRLLDVATGPGYVAAAAAQRGAAAVGIDFAAAMAALARRQYPHVEFREGDAEELPFADDSFDAVVVNFGLLHLGRPEQALAEAHRVLRSGGRIGFTVWAGPGEAVAFGMVLRAIRDCGDGSVALPPGPPFFRFSDPQECRRVLLQAGFVSPQVVPAPQLWRLPSPDAVFQAMQRGTVRTGGLLRAQSRQALHAIRAAMRDAARDYSEGSGIALPMPAVLASAGKP